MTRLATPLIVLLLCGTALAGCASDNASALNDPAVPQEGGCGQ